MIVTDRRFLGVLAAGALIAGVCWYRVATNQPLDYAAQLHAAMSHVPAPTFEGVEVENNGLPSGRLCNVRMTVL